MGYRKSFVAVATSLVLLSAAFTAAGQASTVEGDIIFIVDESGSMGGVQQAVGEEIATVAGGLAGSLDAAFGLVGYGASDPHPVTELGLTDDVSALETALGGLTTNGAFEPGYDATIHALTDPGMNHRAGAGTCVVIATDEPSNADVATQQDAIDALVADEAYFFGIVKAGTASTSFQPLADATNGQLFDLDAFVNDPKPVLDSLLQTCAQQLSSGGVDVDVHPTSCPNPLHLGKRGVVPTAILGSASLDVDDIDPSTVELTGPDGTVSALRTSVEDVAGPDEFPQPESRADCGTDGPDGFDDLTAKFSSADVQSVVGSVSEGDTVVVTLSAEEAGGGVVSGVDILWIR